ncbi:PREDICTED: nuclear cap-binding protein subunit 2-like [Drosophila arizonae]|uniref:Nuclear cap-binding protein subunit 2-like n=1 Tax=Drosophila arizonae TaxID=7263 RepID=A0ABM1PYU9_DROAR|nr:PREDICTED: nuclear cap-binding protein subunit 2-like [Drosophila arizonae]
MPFICSGCIGLGLPASQVSHSIQFAFEQPKTNFQYNASIDTAATAAVPNLSYSRTLVARSPCRHHHQHRHHHHRHHHHHGAAADDDVDDDDEQGKAAAAAAAAAEEEEDVASRWVRH